MRKSESNKYYADVTKSFAEQVPQYQMPKEHTVIWKEEDNFRVEKSLSEYDEYCNITLQQDVIPSEIAIH